MSSTHNSNVELLAVLVDWDDEEEGEYRFLVDGKHVKYVTVDPGVIPKDFQTFGPILIPLLPPFPPGEWNEGHVSKDPVSRNPVFSSYSHSDLPGISNTWHRMRIDHLEFKELRRLRQNIYVVTHPLFDQALFIKLAQFPWKIPFFEAETTAYEWIVNQGVGPKFIAHLTEAGRVIGFVLEYIEGARSADVGDLVACQDSLAQLHSLGIKHGDINKYNFLIRDGKAVLVDFESAQKCSEKKELEAEYEQIGQSLSDPSRRGGGNYLEDH
ncbi:uncharacterized protein TRIVIDRAFT_63870 [Trichoderma virens Gv29-8]|uniref:Alpha-galactosidase A n=1 Tax=Hypocrea virens (strain Gv29-8 / FGSC 10586) TaxID=413071 RepID=G9MPB0_HYPVG|nr:uncharacterized protein TRIVIDRAFT_63870 [Trichoderma virens Gv29-8]EHK23712.1 hypothetical protein TRIVIDRAFT_63870 [Trichoderma virens Gv29-8]UKZ50008.1 hypothetical protein TrVGV298_004264 [Trichoderma virens]